MGSVECRKRSGGETVFLARVRTTGSSKSKSFASRKEAELWVMLEEAGETAPSLPPPPPPAPAPTHKPKKTAAPRTVRASPKASRLKQGALLVELIARYRREIVPGLRSQGFPTTALNFWAARWPTLRATDITPELVVQARRDLEQSSNCRGGLKSGATVNRYLATLSHLFSVALKDWFLVPANPVLLIRKCKESQGRCRYLSDEERVSLLAACKRRSDELHSLVRLSLWTGCRQDELLSLTWGQIDLERARFVLNETKNGDRRGIPLVADALMIIRERREAAGQVSDNALVWPGPKRSDRPITIRRLWERALEDAGITNFRWHDLRHTTASLLAMAGCSPQEIAEILGHRTLQMVKRYSHISVEHSRSVLARLDGKI